MNASSISLGKAKSAFSTSTSVTIAPNERSALPTPVPVASETARSEPGPPLRTAIFLFVSSIIVRSLRKEEHCHPEPRRWRKDLTGAIRGLSLRQGLDCNCCLLYTSDAAD